MTEECIYHRGKLFSRVSNLPEILPVLANHISDVSQSLVRALKSHIWDWKTASRFYSKHYVSKILFGVASLWLMWFWFWPHGFASITGFIYTISRPYWEQVPLIVESSICAVQFWQMDVISCSKFPRFQLDVHSEQQIRKDYFAKKMEIRLRSLAVL